MSYDVDIYKLVHSSNYTSNICTMFNEAMKNCQKQGFIPETYIKWTDVINKPLDNKYLSILINELEQNPAKYLQYEPSNKWGTYDTSLIWLKTIQEQWQEDCHVKISW